MIFFFFFLKLTIQDCIGRDKQKINQSMFKCVKETLYTLSSHLNANLHHKLERCRNNKERRSGSGSFDFHIVNNNFPERLCHKLKILIVAFNNDFMGWCNKYNFYNVSTDQRKSMFDIIIDNDFILYALILIDNTDERNMRHDSHKQLKKKQ
jgi:hypothetical protein